MIQKLSFIFFLIACINMPAIAQTPTKKGDILSIVKNYCEDTLRQDTLVIREGIKQGCIVSSDSHTQISKLGENIIISHFNENERLENLTYVMYSELEFEFKITRDEFMYHLDHEIVECKYNRNKKENYWGYTLINNGIPDTLLDVHNYSLYYLFNELRKKTIKKMPFCDEDLVILQTTKITKTFNIYDTTKSYFDTIITRTMTCTKNGNYITKELLRTGHLLNELDYDSKQLIDSSKIVKVYECKSRYTDISYSKLIYGEDYKVSINYDSNWVALSVFVTKSTKKDKNKNSAYLDLEYSGQNTHNPLEEIRNKNTLGIKKKTFYDESNQVKEFTVRYGEIEKTYIIRDGEKILFTKKIYKHDRIKKVKRYYDYYNEIKERSLYTYNKSGELIEVKTYSKDYSDKEELIEKTTYSYEYDIPY